MNEIVDFFSGLFSTDLWPARWYCGKWSDFHGWLYIISDLMIWLAYFLIPIIIIKYFYGKKGLVNFSSVYILFATFILLCGSTHFIDAMMFWIPMYRLNGLVRFATGIVSMITVYKLFKILPILFAKKTNIELELEIAKRKQAEQKLAEANANLESFAHIASHDLQEPLRKIQTFASLMFKNKSLPGMDDKQLAQKIVHATSRMQNLVKDVLTISTLENDAKLSKINVNDAINMALVDLELNIAEKGARINVSPIPMVIGNQPYLAQVFMNLISNALKFSKSNPVISINGTSNGDRVYIDVTDNGIGIEEQHLDKIFLSFKRLNSRDEYEGSGIGLTTCKRIIEIHQGTISVKSIYGQKTTFTIELPKG